MKRQKPKQTVLTWHITPPLDLAWAVEKVAKAETRTLRNTVIVLLQEALSARNNGNRKGVSCQQ